MHIPDSMLQDGVCAVTVVAAAAALVAAVFCARSVKEVPGATRFAAVTALIFAAQAINLPVMAGVSGHLLGGVLAAVLLGMPFGVLSVALVVAVQGLLFGDGGVATLGANIFNIAVLGAGVGGVLRSRLAVRWKGMWGGLLATAVAAWCSVVIVALAASAEMSFGGRVDFLEVAPEMLQIHALIGLGEAFITSLVCALAYSLSAPRNAYAPLAGALLLATFSPFASALPDGLEWVAAQQGLLPGQTAAPWLLGEPFSGAGAVIGVSVVSVLAWGLSRIAGRMGRG